MTKSGLRPWMVWSGDDPREGAALVYARDRNGAKAWAWKHTFIPDAGDWTDMRLRRLEDSPYFRSLIPSGSLEAGETCGTDDPPTCNVCDTWGSPMRPDGTGCENCGGDDL